MELVGLVAHHDGVSRVGAAGHARADVVLGGEDVHQLALALVAPAATQSLTQSLTHSLTQSLTQSLTHSVAHSVTHSVTHSVSH